MGGAHFPEKDILTTINIKMSRDLIKYFIASWFWVQKNFCGVKIQSSLYQFAELTAKVTFFPLGDPSLPIIR
jgi:hypothetical protein